MFSNFGRAKFLLKIGLFYIKKFDVNLFFLTKSIVYRVLKDKSSKHGRNNPRKQYNINLKL